jgi:hypothetical protein
MLSKAVKMVTSSVILGVSLFTTPCEAKTLKQAFDTYDSSVASTSGVTPYKLKDFDDITFSCPALDDYTFYVGLPSGEKVDDLTIHGRHYAGSKQILLYNNMRNDEQIYTVFYHEVGHAVDRTYRGNTKNPDIELYSQTDEFRECTSEAKYLKDWTYEYYFRSSDEEYFAECISLCITHPSILKSNAPKTYDYIDSVINK